MKRYLLLLGCVCLALLITAPAWALDVDFSGYYRARGFYDDNPNLVSNKTSNSYMDMKFRLNTVFKVSDNVRLTTQFDALDKMWGQDNLNTGNDANNIDFNIAYATIKTPVGGLLIGRQWNTVWGLNVGDSTGPVDRLLYYLPIDKWSIAAYAQMYTEGEASNRTKFESDGDNMKYVALVKYQQEKFEGGLLFAYYAFKSIPTMFQNNTWKKDVAKATAINGRLPGELAKAEGAQATYNQVYQTAYSTAYGTTLLGGGTAAQATQAGITAGAQAVAEPYNGTTYTVAAAKAQGAYATDVQSLGTVAWVSDGPYMGKADVFVPDPYFIGTWGPVTLSGEMLYAFGTAHSYAWSDGTTSYAPKDLTVSALTYLLDEKTHFGPVTFGGGYWYMQGDNNVYDDKHNSFGYLEQNENLDIAFLLTGSSDLTNGGDLQNTLANGIGNYAGNSLPSSNVTTNSGTLAQAGAKLWYLDVKYNILDNLSLKAVYVNAKADAPPGPNSGLGYTSEWSDDVGQEYDVIAKWMPLKNLEYKVVYAYFKAGDFFKMGNPSNTVDDTYTVFNSLTINF